MEDEKAEVLYEHKTGCLWEGGGFKIVNHYCNNRDSDKCPHWKEGKFIPVVEAYNEGGYNSTGVCLACIQDAINSMSPEVIELSESELGKEILKMKVSYDDIEISSDVISAKVLKKPKLEQTKKLFDTIGVKYDKGDN